ncbi:permease YjgP/YjgQ family protein [Candidatus Ruthia magnifica str. Cm (Calyptogena magnifica)]|uniref:Permease YjgP/YjgQ family protein n=1 Tax=Ruthia magnifica subsp. Calyptogena magnifica TaxID=413404 RepID=A1AXG9_RUTMC|nr:LPS export ABC transporter permease LptG [Candidatus Ruthturnera calyptogenae]ABL02626.1 permease YjgP/YjgQ family protein [Candidatus Ruthia magnifica str. Cm (Calyptogena magnifica)]
MKILDRYIVKTMAFYTSAVMLVWLGIYAFFNFLEEVTFIGQANYTVFEVTKYVISDIPAVVYSYSSVIILLGSLLALGHLASTSQLVVIRSAGVSIMQISNIVVRAALMFIAIVIFIGELVTPITIEYAESLRAKALGENITFKNQQGFWLKDSELFIHVKKNFDGKSFQDVTLIKLRAPDTLDSIVHSDSAISNGDNLELSQSIHYQFGKDGNLTTFSENNFEKYSVQVSFNKKLIENLKKDPRELSTWHLYQQIRFLTINHLAADIFEVEIYKRLMKPITLIAMILFSMLFVFGSLRDASLGKNIFLGLMMSLFFELASRIGGVLSLRFDYNHFLSASIPTLLMLVFVWALLKKKSAT